MSKHIDVDREGNLNLLDPEAGSSLVDPILSARQLKIAHDAGVSTETLKTAFNRVFSMGRLDRTKEIRRILLGSETG